MSKLMIVLGILAVAIGVAVGVLGYVAPGQMQVVGLTAEVAALFLMGGILAVGLGGVIDVLNDQRKAYRDLAARAAKIFKEHGALRVVECWGDDVPDGKVTSFPMAVKRKDDETVVFSWIVWPSRAARDAGNKKVFEDERMKAHGPEMPFDGQRMIFGGFEVLLER